MQVFSTKKELKSYLRSKDTKDCTIGVVPTMGALHLGHLSLVKRAVSENTIVVVTIFVNPTQFDNQDDLIKYPKTLEKDIQQLQSVADDIIIFAPSTAEIYSDTIKSKSYNFNGLENVMEGQFRKGHFDGVGTIIEEFFTLVKPDKAYFGEKDFQQLQIIKKLVAIKKLSVEIIGCPIIREPNGLAMSSRNERLSKALRKEAGFIYRTLLLTKEKFSVKSANYVTNWVENQFESHSKLKLEYIKITDADTLKPVLRKQKNKKYRAFIAVYVNGIRLIDNIAL
ncbi:MAG: pantoate--beta-alanine ligase [Saonia sp.]